jgi:hypothetical protein
LVSVELIERKIRDAVRHMQEAEAMKQDRALLANFEDGLPKAERAGIRRGVRQGMKDISAGRYHGYDADGLKGLAHVLVATSAKRAAGRSKSR